MIYTHTTQYDTIIHSYYCAFYASVVPASSASAYHEYDFKEDVSVTDDDLIKSRHSQEHYKLPALLFMLSAVCLFVVWN